MVFNIYNFLEFKLALTEYFWYVYLLVFVWKPNLLCLVVFYTSFVTSVYQDISLSIDMGLFSNLALKHPICLNIFLLTLITSYSNMVVFVGFIALVLGSWWAGSEFN
jgi:hypothetical protein